MRRLVTGVDAAGRSCVVEEKEFPAGTGLPGITTDTVFATHTSPPPTRPAGHGDFVDLEVAAGLVQWDVVELGPGSAVRMHHTDTIDFDIVLAGSIELILDDGVHPLAPGDCVLIGGVDHAWHAGDDGCRLSVVALGTPPLSS